MADTSALQTVLAALNTAEASAWAAWNAYFLVGSGPAPGGTLTTSHLNALTTAINGARGSVQTGLTALGLDSDIQTAMENLWNAMTLAQIDAGLARAAIATLS